LYRQKFEFDYPMSHRGRALQEMLRVRSLQMQEALGKEIRDVVDSGADEDAYINSVIDRWSIKIPQFDFDVDHIKKNEQYEDRQGSDMFGGSVTRKAWIVTFGFAYTGQIEFLKYIPRAGSDLSLPEFTFDSQYMYFSAWVWDQPEKNVQSIKAEKEKAMAFLQKRVTDATPELEQFNQALPGSVRGLFDAQKQKRLNDRDVLKHL
jgi:hypothetical protein